MAETRNCSRCDNALDTEGYPRWCSSCRKAYKREYDQTRKEMGEGKGFLAGAEAMRLSLLGRIGSIHPGIMTNYGAIQEWLRKFPTPRP